MAVIAVGLWMVVPQLLVKVGLATPSTTGWMSVNMDWVVGSTFLFTYFVIVGWLVTRFHAQCNDAAYAMRLPGELLPKLFIVRTAADEASAVLAACQAGTWLLRNAVAILLFPALAVSRIMKPDGLIIRLSAVIIAWYLILLPLLIMFLIIVASNNWLGEWLRLQLKVDSVLRISVTVACLLPFAIVAWWLVKQLPHFFFPLTQFVVSWLAIAVCLCAVLLFSTATRDLLSQIILGAFFLLVFIAPILTAFFLGLRFAFAFIFLDITTEPAPSGSHTFRQFGLRGDLRKRIQSLLNHSVAYQAPEIITEITDWIGQTDALSRGYHSGQSQTERK